MPIAYSYDLDHLPSDHPNLYAPEVQTWASCIAISGGVVARATATLEFRARAGLTRGRATRDSLALVAASHSTVASNASLVATVPASQVSERAGLGVAAAAMAVTAGLRIREVTLRGDKGDFWLEDSSGVPRGMCEMSATTTRPIEDLYRQKRSQILENATVRESYTAVVRFHPNAAYFCRVR